MTLKPLIANLEMTALDAGLTPSADFSTALAVIATCVCRSKDCAGQVQNAHAVSAEIVINFIFISMSERCLFCGSVNFGSGSVQQNRVTAKQGQVLQYSIHLPLIARLTVE